MLQELKSNLNMEGYSIPQLSFSLQVVPVTSMAINREKQNMISIDIRYP
jgi:hypothetical protein